MHNDAKFGTFVWLAILGWLFFGGPYEDYSAYAKIRQIIYESEMDSCGYLKSYAEKISCKEYMNETSKPSFAKWVEEKKELISLKFDSSYPYHDKVVVFYHIKSKEEYK